MKIKHLVIGLLLIALTGGLYAASTDYKVTNDGTIYSYDLITKGPWVDVRAFMDGQSGRPTYATWYANQATTVMNSVFAAAYAATLQGQTLYVPSGLYRVTSSPGTPAISITKSISFIGDYSG
jgi:hypothetical protein